MSEEPERTALYRCYDDPGALLYIGISKDFGQRWKNEAHKFWWWPEVRSQTVYWHDSRPEALAAETAAIKAERPRHNKDHLRPRKPRRLNAADPPLEVAVASEPAGPRTLLDLDRLLNPEELAAYLGKDCAELDRLAREGGGPVFYEFGRFRRYAGAEVREWLAEVAA